MGNTLYDDVLQALARAGRTEDDRLSRVLFRVLGQLSQTEWSYIVAFVQRWQVNQAAQPTPAERTAMQRMNALIRADSEALPTESIVPPARAA